MFIYQPHILFHFIGVVILDENNHTNIYNVTHKQKLNQDLFIFQLNFLRNESPTTFHMAFTYQCYIIV